MMSYISEDIIPNTDEEFKDSDLLIEIEAMKQKISELEDSCMWHISNIAANIVLPMFLYLFYILLDWNCRECWIIKNEYISVDNTIIFIVVFVALLLFSNYVYINTKLIIKKIFTRIFMG
jgi:hypothetical protein